MNINQSSGNVISAASPPLRFLFRSSIFLFLLLVTATTNAQTEHLKISLLSDLDRAGGPSFDSLIIAELEPLLSSRYDLSITTLYTGGEARRIDEAAQRAYTSADFVIGSGLATSSVLMNRSIYPKPTIAAVVLDRGTSRGNASSSATEKIKTGIENFTFVQSPFDIERDLEALKGMTDYEQLTVVTTANLLPTLQTVIERTEGNEVDYLLAMNSADNILDQLPSNATAVYLTPLDNVLSLSQEKLLLDSLTARGIASFGLIDQPLLELGGLAAYSSSENLSKLPRRVALDVLRVLDGTPAAELDTRLTTFDSGLIINMAAARAAGIYPSWDIMHTATLLNPNELPDARILTLEGAVLEGLANNLGYDLSEYDVALAKTDLNVAKSNLLPQVEVATTVTRLDGQTVASSFGQQGQYNWTANGTINQVVLSEPAFANVTINKLLLEGQQAALEVTQLDVVLDVVTAYLNTLQAKVFADLQNENLAVTRANLSASGTKREAGVVGASDVYRWESELALNQIEVNNSQVQLEQARYNLNQILNRPINEEFQLPEFTGQDSLLGLVGQTLLPMLNDPRDIDRLANFLAQEARQDLPTLRQLEAAIAAQERQLLSSKRALYLPTVGLNGQYNYRIANYGTIELPPELGIDFGGDDRPRGTYTIALNASFPIFQGGKRKAQAEQARVATLQAQTQRRDVENQLLQRLYSNVETLVASYRNVQLARSAAETSTKNFRIIEDLYRAGATNITSLVDAQNVTLQSNINATNAACQFVADFIALQRSTGSYKCLENENEQLDFIRRFIEFK